ncbi:hypothetical protein J6590_100118, partial [Homalodisca vitripennis]
MELLHTTLFLCHNGWMHTTRITGSVEEDQLSGRQGIQTTLDYFCGLVLQAGKLAAKSRNCVYTSNWLAAHDGVQRLVCLLSDLHRR